MAVLLRSYVNWLPPGLQREGEFDEDYTLLVRLIKIGVGQFIASKEEQTKSMTAEERRAVGVGVWCDLFLV
mgnify:CR=1 FL=1